MRRAVLCVAVVGCLAVAGEAAAQGFAIGPRVSFVRGNQLTGEPSSRLLGGAMRMGGSKHVALELSLDYRSIRELGSTTRVREIPAQGSLLIYLVRSVFAPYLLGGAGIYNRMVDQLGPDGEILVTVSERKFGVHLGFGAEIRFMRHMAIFADYRYRFVRFGTPEANDQPINIPGKSVIPGLDKVNVSHQGSMWTTGLAFYF
jgi:opacity protein-like surface antigen